MKKQPVRMFQLYDYYDYVCVFFSTLYYYFHQSPERLRECQRHIAYPLHDLRDEQVTGGVK